MMRRAFTLIELLVVIAIIAILAAVLFPVFTRAKVAAKSAVTTSNLKQLATGCLLYSADYDDITPLFETPQIETTGSNQMYLMQRLYPYVKNLDIYWDAMTKRAPLERPMIEIQSGGYWGSWTTYANLSANGFGLFAYRPAGSEIIYGRSFSAQENLSQRSMYINTAWPGEGPQWGHHIYINTAALKPNYNNPNEFWSNNVWNARDRYFGQNVCAFGDTHIGKVRGSMFLPPGGDYNAFYTGDVLAFWGSYNDGTL